MLVLTLLLNTAASIGDLAVADRVRRYPARTLFTAEQTGIKVYILAVPHGT
jgi:hypothetical protein